MAGHIDQAPARSVLDHIGPGRAAVAADLDLLPADSAPLVPETVSVVSLVMKSEDELPVSLAIAVIAKASAGAAVSMVTAWLAAVPILPAVSTIRA